MSDRLDVVVIGCGKMGKLHARVCSQLPGARLAGVYDTDRAVAAAVAEPFGARVLEDLDHLAGSARAAIVATPTSSHVSVASRCLEAGLDVLIEKPLAATAAECRAVAEAAKRLGRIVQVGHVERFNPIVRAMTRQKLDARYMDVTRVSPMTFRSIDVGVVLDMMIHDIDIVLLLARGSPVEAVEAVGVAVIGEVEDVCNARVRFASGCVANLTASRLALKVDRKLRVFSPDAYLSIDYARRHGVIVRRGENLAAIREAAAKIRSGEVRDISQLNYADLVRVEELSIDDVEPLRAEQESFLAAVRNRTRPEVSAEDGLAAVELANRIVQAARAPVL